MALQGISGTGAAAALEKFQAIRDIAKKRMEGGDSRIRLTDLVQKKQLEMGLEQASPGGSAVSSVSAVYGRAGAAEKPDPHPKLGRYIDFRA